MQARDPTDLTIRSKVGMSGIRTTMKLYLQMQNDFS